MQPPDWRRVDTQVNIRSTSTLTNSKVFIHVRQRMRSTALLNRFLSHARAQWLEAILYLPYMRWLLCAESIT
jgi:hypothetical protein